MFCPRLRKERPNMGTQGEALTILAFLFDFPEMAERCFQFGDLVVVDAAEGC